MKSIGSTSGSAASTFQKDLVVIKLTLTTTGNQLKVEHLHSVVMYCNGITNPSDSSRRIEDAIDLSVKRRLLV